MSPRKANRRKVRRPHQRLLRRARRLAALISVNLNDPECDAVVDSMADFYGVPRKLLRGELR